MRTLVPDRFGCVGSTIKTSSGSYFDLESPTPEQIDLKSIASALSKICRFGGHCPNFYSVAEHCIHCVIQAAKRGVDRDGLIAILLHDATEAYVGDMVRPLKAMLPGYSEVESRIEAAIGKRFGVDFGMHHDLIKQYDNLLLKAEKTTFWPEDSEKWKDFETIADIEVEFFMLEPYAAQSQFLFTASLLKIDSN